MLISTINDNQIDDLKQSIANTISNATTNMVTKDEFSNDLAITNKKIDDGFVGVVDAIEEINTQIDKLEKQAA